MELGIQPNRSPSFGPLIRKCIFNTYLNRVFSPRNPFLFFSFFLLLSFLFQHQSHLHLYYLIDTHNGYSTSTLNGVIYAPIINDIIISVFIQLIIEFFFFFFLFFSTIADFMYAIFSDSCTAMLCYQKRRICLAESSQSRQSEGQNSSQVRWAHRLHRRETSSDLFPPSANSPQAQGEGTKRRRK